MLRKRILLAALSVLVILPCAASNPLYIYSRAPLNGSSFTELPLGAIHPEGWLLDQLQRQADGLTGHLDEAYASVVGADNAWIGGNGDTWERGPYWIDGLLPLAYILGDQALIDKALVWVEAMLSSQTADGYFGPSKDNPPKFGLQTDNSHDWWPKMVALKVLKQYYMATADERVIPFLLNYFRYQKEHLPETPLGHWTFWGQQRGGDNLEIVLWLYDVTGEQFLLELAELIHSQTLDWTGIFTRGAELHTQNSLHCVNLAQGFKEPVVYWRLSGNRENLDAPSKAVSMIRHTIGFPTGLWAGDELLRFGIPTNGSEFCTCVEMMFSLEEMLRITADPSWADYLERVAFNALPTQADDEFRNRQYFQQVNQVECTRKWRDFVTSHGKDDIVFGVLNGYPCCTCNMHQGWPKFAQNLWYASHDGGAAAFIYSPCRAEVSVAGGLDAVLTEKTGYPFNGTVSISIDYKGRKVKSASFPLWFRIPSWCTSPSVKVNGEPVSADLSTGSVARIEREWKKGDVLTLEFPMEVYTERWYDLAGVVLRGPLIYALRMNENWGMDGDCRTVTSDTPWDWCLRWIDVHPDHCREAFRVVDRGVGDAYPWNTENAPVSLFVKANKLLDWTLYRGQAGHVAYSSQQKDDIGEQSEIELIPYGCTTLRIAEFPVR